MPSKYDMAANEPATYAWGEAQDPEEEAEWREQSRRVAAVVEAAVAFCRESRKQGNEASIVAWLVAHDHLDTATRALLELETEDESDD